MAREIPPFGGYEDQDVERVLSWFRGFIESSEWDQRISRIEEQLEAVLEPRPSRTEAQTHGAISIADDRIAWYLYLADTALHSPLKYEPIQGSRVIPIFKRLGADLELLQEIGGVEDRVARMMTNERRQPDSALFELLVALLWRRNDCELVEFIQERPTEKTPDIRALKGSEEWFIECKRLQKSSAYSEREREKWLVMWARFRDFLVDSGVSAVFDIVFHVELDSLPDDFVMQELSGKLALIQMPCEIVSNETWDVSAKPVDYSTAKEHLRKYRVKYPSDQINELIAGYRDANRGFTGMVAGRIVRIGEGGGNNRFLDEMSFAAGAFWHCDAEQVIARKARDIRGHLADAVRQLPDDRKCAIHVGLETLDGPAVEETRFLRILRSVVTFDSSGKDLRWIYCHLIQSYAPPDEIFVIDETVHHFGQSQDSGNEPLSHRSVIVPEDANSQDGVHWLRAPP